MKRYFNQLLLTLLLSIFCLPIFSQTTLFDYGSSWSYYDNQNEPAVQGSLDWNDVTYDASLWSTGNAHLGYGDGDEVTVINSNTYTAYVRHSFNVADPSNYNSLNLNLTYDDGAVVYLNGTEVWRVNLPDGSISYGTFTPTTASDNSIISTTIADALLTGTNVLAVEIHQRSATSSDISFDFKLSGNAPGQVNITRGPYLQKGTPTSMVVRWRTLVPTESVIDYGTSLGNLNQNSTDLTLRTEHEVEITGLNANTVYYYEISNASTVLHPEANDVFFKTHPTTGSTQPFTFWALGDAGTANNNARAVRDAYYNYIGTNVTDGILFLGDNAYNDGTDNEYQLAVFENMYEDKLKNSVAWSCLGNHDGHSADSNTQTGPYYDIFTFPTAGESGGMASGTEAYYSFDYGNVHFIVLDSYETDRSVESAMYNWAQSDIQNTIQEWIIAFWHHPPYTKGSHDSDTEGQLIDMRQNFLPMLESNGVDLVLSGHSHSYERSYLLNGHYGTSGTFNSVTNTVGATGDGDGRIDGNGVYTKETSGVDAGKGAVYITAGSSGKVTGTLTNHNAMAVSLYELGSCIVEVDGSTLNVKFIRETGAIDDYFTIDKSSECTVSTDTASGDIETYVGNIIDNAPGSSGDNYVVPNASELTTWNTVIDFILADDLVNSRSNACDINYQVTEFTDTSLSPNQIFYVLEEKSPQQNYWGTYVFSKTPDRDNLVILAPHSKYDTNTGKEAIHCFKNNVAKAVFINGTHRCNNSIYSTCSGTTSSCGTSGEDYRVSDLAHNTNSMFQKTTENLFNNVSNSVFVQLHGFSKQASDPYVIMSNGTRITPSPDYATLIQDALLVEDNTLTFELAHINTSWTRLIGFTNTQGRLINNSADFCNTSATTTTGRFIHIEQEKTKLRDDVTGWTKMSNALSNAFPIGCAADTDGDGVCDVDDQCPGQDDALIGTPCDDGDPCTENDIYDANCGCAGTFSPTLCPQIVNFTGTEQNDLTVQFYDASDFSGSSWLWEFGDGNTSTLQNPVHTYASTGNYDICLTVDGIQACKTNTFSVTQGGLQIKYDDTVWPNGSTSDISSPFGSRLLSGVYDFHRGLDIIGNSGDPIVAFADGEVYRAYDVDDPNSPYSSTIVIVKHEMDTPMYFHGLLISTYFSHYSHMNSITSGIVQGLPITKGQQVGTVGMTGATHNHNHFEIRVGVQCSRESQEGGGCSSSTPFPVPTDPHVNPLLFLNYDASNTNSLIYSITQSSPLTVDIFSNREEVDFNKIIVSSGGTTKTVNFDNREGIDPANIDNNNYDNIEIYPEAYTRNGGQDYRMRFVFSDLNGNDTIEVADVWGNLAIEDSIPCVFDNDGDGVCDADDQCPGFDDTIDTNSNGIPDGCENICSSFTTNFIDNPLTHSGSNSNSTVLLFPADSQDVTFMISGINQKLNGKASRKYIESVVVTYVDEFGVTQPYDSFSGANISSANIDIQGKVQSITVNLSDELDGSTDSTMDISFSQVDYCINSTPCTPDSDGDGVCDAEDQCPGQDDALIGTVCDDGDNCTTGETYDNSCNCSGGVYTDNDGDGFCIGDDPDDNDGCNPDPNSGACSPCGDIINDGFESGFGNWNDGGGDCARTTTNPNTGIYSVRLRDNSGVAASMFTNALDLTSYSEVTFNFSYYPVSMENGEDFFLEVSTNGGSTYSIYQSWVSGTDFNNNIRYDESVSITGISFTNITVFRLRCDASKKNDQVYIDDVVLTDCNGAMARTTINSQTKQSLSKEIKIYPNPVSYTLFVRYDDEANINLYNINGQIVRNINMNGKISQTQEIDLNGLADGLYLLRIIDLNGTIIKTKRIVIKSN